MKKIKKKPPKLLIKANSRIKSPFSAYICVAMNLPLQYGIDVILQQSAAYKYQRIALVTNNAAITSTAELSRVALLNNGFNITTIFSPEHGITTTGDDGAFQQNITDTVTGLPIISLYGNRLAPTPEDLQNIDLVLFDIPDVGCRFYTYLWTMTHVMEACAVSQKPFVVLDRPNPIGADLLKAEGPFLDEQACSSFIGRWSIPIKHCCTLGELALYFTATKISGLHIDIIKVQHYNRTQTAVHDFFFTPTSPAIQNIQTALFYPGTGLLEGINIDEGRGTLKPFQQCGAPWINAKELQQLLQQKNLPGLSVTATSYTARAGQYANKTCYGVELHISNEKEFMAVQAGIALLQCIQQLYPQHIAERLYTTNANPTGKGHLNKLLGINNAFQLLQTGQPVVTDIKEEWTGKINAFLLYSL